MIFSALKSRPGVEITPVNGDVVEIDVMNNSSSNNGGNGAAAANNMQKKPASPMVPSNPAGKGSKLESALDRLGMGKRKVPAKYF